jgi:hypothetical protein
LSAGSSADREPADGQPWKIQRRQRCKRIAPQVQVHAALHDAEQIAGRRPAGLIRTVVASMTARRPAHRALHRGLGLLMGGRKRRAVVEGHRDVRAERALHVHRIFGGQAHFAAVHRRLEAHTLLRDLAQFFEAEHLEAAGVREDRTAPMHETVQPTMRGDNLRTRPQHQVERVS